jgi:hypothetical protein
LMLYFNKKIALTEDNFLPKNMDTVYFFENIIEVLDNYVARILLGIVGPEIRTLIHYYLLCKHVTLYFGSEILFENIYGFLSVFHEYLTKKTFDDSYFGYFTYGNNLEISNNKINFNENILKEPLFIHELDFIGYNDRLVESVKEYLNDFAIGRSFEFAVSLQLTEVQIRDPSAKNQYLENGFKVSGILYLKKDRFLNFIIAQVLLKQYQIH